MATLTFCFLQTKEVSLSFLVFGSPVLKEISIVFDGPELEMTDKEVQSQIPPERPLHRRNFDAHIYGNRSWAPVPKIAAHS
jgi:hypothetical protein